MWHHALDEPGGRAVACHHPTQSPCCVATLRLRPHRCPAQVRSCKACTDAEQGIVVGGEYGISAALLEVRVKRCNCRQK